MNGPKRRPQFLSIYGHFIPFFPCHNVSYQIYSPVDVWYWRYINHLIIVNQEIGSDCSACLVKFWLIYR